MAGGQERGRSHDGRFSLGFGRFTIFNDPREAPTIENQTDRFNQPPHVFRFLAELTFRECRSLRKYFEIVFRYGRCSQISKCFQQIWEYSAVAIIG